MSAIPVNVPKFIEKWQLNCKCHPSAVIIIWQFAVYNRVYVIELQFEDMTIGSLSEDAIERCTSTGSELFSLFICLDSNKFVLLSFFSLIKTIKPRVSTKPLPNDAKVHFRLASVAQKRYCLSSLIMVRFVPERNPKI